ncbi:bacillithiol biosynthesis cysteine-adding enzyme BshC [Pullulanibacillus sp. KACC 23026]|uniref:bacillithiol biosynthesis cysteine-adding enzyme BshC n=1 Tax=Pullulanibacillus sp. KACC 23026 TaxID=3028315 RepID=UPI0023B04032|nr:bacillithiol biosynthesis cysteine-adding enzyme BshC [Pullulanibacillus sp. KACC 23026]WEG11671.1 bacillithiol biosynthesis cysteine-adding enzyme BshC [Pullulanibacillus sp. KACC 23026]
MDVKLIDLPKPSPLVEAYSASSPTIHAFFDYDYNSEASYQKRLEELSARPYKRAELVQVLTQFNQRLSAPSQVFENINRLTKPNSVVVVGGQQAGLLTGPIFTIHKCLAILQLAREKEEQLKVPVVPVFWIAGEDHDFAEVNHVFFYQQNSLRKFPFKIKGSGQSAVSDLPYNPDELEKWVEEVFRAFGETEFTEELLKQVKQTVREADTLVSFFGRLIHQLFGKYGLVLMDSADPHLRKIESSYFAEMIDRSEKIATGVTSQLERLKQAGYTVQLDQTDQSANLFVTHEQQRILLTRDQGDFVNTDKGFRKTKEELLGLTECAPHLLSNNVVTRPLMQDLVLPTLAFVAGPGEIAYWSALQPAFHSLGILMPPVVPRFHLVMVNRQAEKWLQEKNLTVEDVLKGKLRDKKEEWLKAQHEWEVDRYFETAREAMKTAYQPYKELAVQIHSELNELSRSNWDRIEHQMDYLKKQMERYIRVRHQTELSRFDYLEAQLFPNNGPQERSWSVYAFLNEYGPDLVDRLMKERYSYNGRQYAVFL